MARVVLGMIGLGTVGSGVVQLLAQHKHLQLKKIAVRDLQKERAANPTCPITENVSEIIDDPEIEVLVEVMGGEEPALTYIRRALEKRKHVVTANKEVLAKHGPSLFQLAREKGVTIFFEASVAGGIPLISTIQRGLGANQFAAVTGILNGTTNFILSNMEEKGLSYDSVLAEAQRLGFAEADPSADVDGHDVAYKLSILAALSFQRFVKPEDIYREGIRNITPDDLALAKEFGYRIKLVGTARNTDPKNKAGALAVRVHPTLVPLAHPLAAVSGSSNCILVNGDAVGEIIMVGPGAGSLPTASAVVGDIINLESALKLPDFASYFQPSITSEWSKTASPDDWTSPYFLRLSVKDTPGVIGTIGTIFGEHKISIQSIIQRGVADRRATIVILTHDVRSGNMEAALADLKKCEFLDSVASAIRIYKAA
ncbi:MAG: homoserine dehydrogenase [Cyanobacteria bacterium REEB67]|nr:homoserine dehydrogenase [Cyanobacteria bacterium REEB67]